MSLPLMPASAGSRGRSRSAGAAFLLLLVLLAGGAPVRAQEGDPFSATVKVDATADTVAKAREMARIDGQRRALAAIVERLAGGTSAKPPRLDDNAITNLVASFEVANEKMSAVRYIADYTFHFRPAETRRMLADAGITVGTAEVSGKPIVIVPVYEAEGQPRLWDDPNPWRDSWERLPAAAGGGRFVVPLGDAGDLAAIDAEKARAGDAEALAALARRNGAEGALVAVASLRGPADRPAGLDVMLRRHRAGRATDSRSDAFAANPGESADDLLRRAAAAIVSDIGRGWKTETAASQGQWESLTAVLPIAGLDDWLRARERLAAVPAIRKLALVALSRQEATIEIGYSGTIGELKSELARISLDLVHGEPAWRLARTGPGRAP
jgi:hypothetical protein